MPVEHPELSAHGETYAAELQLPAGNSDHGALLLPGANHTAFDDAVFDRLAATAADAGIQFLRYQGWDDGEELAAKSETELAAEIDAALDHLTERGCTRLSLVAKSAGGRVALQHVPAAVDQLVLWAPALFVADGDALAEMEIPEGADPSTITASELAEIEVPAVILQGDEDHIPVANARELAAGMPNAEMQVIEGADHSFVGGQPEDDTIETTIDVLTQDGGER